MSLYFFTLDSLRVLSSHHELNESWPQPSIKELADALEGLCGRSWAGDLEDIQHNSHEYTRAEVLPHRCFESVYMVTLLRDGFGFHPESRDITFTFLVDGSEVEWSLGMALELYAMMSNKVKSVVDADVDVDVNITCDYQDQENATSQEQRQEAIPLPDSSLSLIAPLVQGSD
jgi:GDA1/CD39 (nucleoside phosphatase) family